jgi:hypothetical protein
VPFPNHLRQRVVALFIRSDVFYDLDASRIFVCQLDKLRSAVDWIACASVDDGRGILGGDVGDEG